MSNNISIFGRLTADPESRYSQSGQLIVNFTLADNRGDKASFFNCTAFGKTAENISKSLKGHRLYVGERMEQDEWTDQQTGQQRKAWKVVVNDMNYVEPAPQPQQQQPPAGFSPYGTQPQQYGRQSAPPPGYRAPQAPPSQPQQYPPTQPGYPPQPPQNYNHGQDVPF